MRNSDDVFIGREGAGRVSPSAGRGAINYTPEIVREVVFEG